MDVCGGKAGPYEATAEVAPAVRAFAAYGYVVLLVGLVVVVFAV